MKKRVIGLFIFCLFTLALFGGFAYLLAHVDPPRMSPLPPLPNSGKTAGTPKRDRPKTKPPTSAKTEAPTPADTEAPTSADAEAPPIDEPDDSSLRRREGYESHRDRPFEIYSYKRGTDDDTDDVDTATKITIIFETKIVNTTEKYTEKTTEVVRQFSSVVDDTYEVAPNTSQLISSVKGFRRSVVNKAKEVDNSLLLKIMDDNGKPRLEILIGNNGDIVKKLGKKNRLPRSKSKSKLYMFVKSDNNTIVDRTDDFKPTVIRVMPNNSLVVSDPDGLSDYPNISSYNSTVDLKEERFKTVSKNDSALKLFSTDNSIHEVDENFTYRTTTKNLDGSYTIKVRFDDKTEILRNENNIDNLKQNVTNSDNPIEPIKDKYINTVRLKQKKKIIAILPKYNPGT